MLEGGREQGNVSLGSGKNPKKKMEGMGQRGAGEAGYLHRRRHWLHRAGGDYDLLVLLRVLSGSSGAGVHILSLLHRLRRVRLSLDRLGLLGRVGLGLHGLSLCLDRLSLCLDRLSLCLDGLGVGFGFHVEKILGWVEVGIKVESNCRRWFEGGAG